LIPQLQPGNIIIIDNTTFHQGQSIQEIVEEAGCEIWYLPPYPSSVRVGQNLDLSLAVMT
jgi:transposase